jgi:AmiR/NasT family two-component response regulator
MCRMSRVAPLRVLVAAGLSGRAEEVAAVVRSLGHQVVGPVSGVAKTRRIADAQSPDVGIVSVGETSSQALELIARIVREAAFPVIAVLDVQDQTFITEAARLGIFAYIAHREDLDELQSAIEVSLQRFSEYHALQGAFGRRAVTERAKGIIMERHSVDEEQAFNILRDQARRTNRKIVDVAEAVLSAHPLLPRRGDPPPGDPKDGLPSLEEPSTSKE